MPSLAVPYFDTDVKHTRPPPALPGAGFAPRSTRHAIFLLCLCLATLSTFPTTTVAGPLSRYDTTTATRAVNLNLCVYKSGVYLEGDQVVTEEPCLNCTCSRGSIVCYLRVCQEIPDPPPLGCIILHRYHTCCAQLICTGLQHGGNRIESRAEPDPIQHLPLPFNQSMLSNGCIANGSVYAEGSAMTTSSHCEHCFCLARQMRCVKPRCLLPLEGCQPIYERGSCCPIRYKCSETITPSSTSTTVSTFPAKGCHINGDFHPEGEQVIGVGHSTCDNCYCLRGVVRCEPLSCAPPLLGCEPVIKSGHCCATSYNCSGTIEVKLTGHYNKVPDVSKNYAKLRKEQDSIGVTSRHFAQSTILATLSTLIAEIKNYQTTKEPTIEAFDSNVIDGRNNRRIDEMNNGTDDEVSTSETTEFSTTETDVTTTEAIESTTESDWDRTTEFYTTSTTFDAETTTLLVEPSNNTMFESKTEIITVENCTETLTPSVETAIVAAGNKTRIFSKIEERIDNEAELSDAENFISTVTTTPRTFSMHNNMSRNISNETKSEMTISPVIEAILNITKNKDADYEYDYNEPSLPPSLPNLKIIPFVAADAVDENLEIPTLHNPTSFPSLTQEKIMTNSPIYRFDTHSLAMFSPPMETEGGFLPREPPLLDHFYENSYHTTKLIDITSATPPTMTTNLPKINDDSCIHKGIEYRHGELLSNPDACVLCLCFFGDVVCQEPKCPPLKPGCHRVSDNDPTVCCGHVICDDDSPTVVLDRSDITSNSQDVVTVAEGIVTHDPFRDVIRTEPAPDLQSLIGDIIPFLSLHTTPIPANSSEIANTTTTTTSPPPTTTTHAPILEEPAEEDFSFDKMLELLFSEESTTKVSTTTPKVTTTPKLVVTTSKSEVPKTTSEDSIESRIVNRNDLTNYIPVEFPEKVAEKPIVTKEKIKFETEKKTTSTSTTTIATTTTTEQNEHTNDLVKTPNSGGGLLKLAGCNIYGRMYRVGRIIFELSGPCLECMCTDVGVQCRPLKC